MVSHCNWRSLNRSRAWCQSRRLPDRARISSSRAAVPEQVREFCGVLGSAEGSRDVLHKLPIHYRPLMGATVEGIVAKVHRVDESIQNLDAEFTRFAKDNYRIEGKFDLESRRYRFRAVGSGVAPLRFAVLTGEIIQHLRSALDHLVTQLAEVGPGGGDPAKLEFPICLNEKQFKNASEYGKLRGIPGDAFKIVESWQPYRTSDPAEHSTLWVLHDLNRIDKHRLLLVVVAAVMMADQIAINTTKHVGIDVDQLPPPTPVGTRPSEGGTEVFSVPFTDKFDPNVTIDGDFKFQMAFGQSGIAEHQPLIPMLNNMRNTTVANSFGQFLKPVERASENSALPNSVDPPKNRPKLDR
jgi:hypothetical protein